jgi:hypothetical protein
MTNDTAPALWIKDPLAILANGAERGFVVQDGRIVELVAAGPATVQWLQDSPTAAESHPEAPTD